ncbi:type 2 isopentenyl-diphosphate Delta-isomerase [Sediminibacillus dalangtanensis]|uniref:Isopentenyl-diphosphate delta-isomerase n=1 Tax=Sediminibacillus dalangtanensis TaxID=2729421 RepID=A0ABX7VV75_9BACI|nr:type 2 isopentenyl-diphosphate Delta-isomerase [Sediminibacillus dalangtanensis]QTM99670.1 type 2 isopentenyl-diphosphate Delta-isomerase [Sediminibacillus dalangtanensis]
MTRQQRKLEHIKYAVESNQEGWSPFDDMEIVHQSVTSLRWEDIDLHTKVGGLALSSPLFVNAMTGGGGIKTEKINAQLAAVAAETGIGMSVGSQMSALKDSTEEPSYRIVRKENPKGIIFANIGSESSVEQARRAVDMLEADALQIHLNVLQELIMPEGDRDFRQMDRRIEAIVQSIPVPVIVKEVGHGLSKETAIRLQELGVQFLDAAGMGGTNFSKVENRRRKDPLSAFNSWGIPTPASVKEIRGILPGAHLLASGGIRNGMDGAKSLILGAEAFGMAGSLLKVLMEEGMDSLSNRIASVHQELKIIMMLLECREPKQLAGKPYVVTGYLKEWFDQRAK